MIKLVIIELKKILKHKSIFVMFGIMFIFCLFNNILYKVDYDYDGNYKYEDEFNINGEIKKQEEELKQYNINNDNDKNMYITIKSKLDVLNIQKKYSKNSWQYIKINDYLYDDIYNLNYYTYGEKNEGLISKYTERCKQKLKYFSNNDWKFFVTQEKTKLLENRDIIENSIATCDDKKLKGDLEEELRQIDRDLVVINYRISSNIDYGNNYLNRAVEEYSDSLKKIDKYKNKKMTFQDKIMYREEVANNKVSKYIIDNKVNLNKQNNLNYQLRTIVDDYELFVIIIILLSTSILIGEEFSKGTIKLLLIKPYRRSKILLSKLLASITLLILTIVFLILTEFILGGVMFGFDSLKMGVAIYHFSLNKLEIFSIYEYMLIRIFAKLPMLFMILIISFLLGVIINNTVAPFSITILIYTFSEVINNLIINYNLKFMQYFLTINWNFKDYLFGEISNYRYINLKKSILIYIIYVIIFIGVMFRSFAKKNIKNV